MKYLAKNALHNAKIELKRAELGVKYARVSVLIDELLHNYHTWNGITSRQFDYLLGLRNKIHDEKMRLYEERLNEWED